MLLIPLVVSSTKYITSGNTAGGKEEDVVLEAEQSVPIVTETPGRCSVEAESGSWKGMGSRASGWK